MAKRKKQWIIGDDGDKEWLCDHGVGHGDNVHTCDGCCGKRKKHRVFIVPGFITSCTDGDRHYINANQLADLYNVNLRDCIVTNDFRGYDLGNDDIVLKPRYDGKYNKIGKERASDE